MADTTAHSRDHLRQAGLAAQRGQRGAAPRMLFLIANMPPTCMMRSASALTWCIVFSIA